ncbi:MAG: heavy metal-binding domain-containing protein [Bacteroidota bacterium]
MKTIKHSGKFLLTAIFLLSASIIAQDKIDSSKAGHNMMKHNHSKMHEMMNDSFSTQDLSKIKLEENKPDSGGINKHDFLREGAINLTSIDENKDGKVFQDQMHWNVISDEKGECPLCEMELKEVTLNKAKDNLLKNGFEVIEFGNNKNVSENLGTKESDNHSKMHTMVTKEVWNKYCPVTGKKISARAETLEYNGKLIGFCCAGSDHHKVFLKDPEKYMKNLSSDGQNYINQ